MEVIVKHNKADPDDMLDDINAKLIEVCERYLSDKNIWLDKFQLATIVMDLYTQTISELDEPFKVIAKESKALVQEYLEKNTKKREALERIQKENESLDKEIAVRESELKEKKRTARNIWNDFVAKPEMPSENSDAGYQGSVPGGVKKQKKQRWTDALAIDNFRLPM